MLLGLYVVNLLIYVTGAALLLGVGAVVVEWLKLEPAKVHLTAVTAVLLCNRRLRAPWRPPRSPW